MKSSKYKDFEKIGSGSYGNVYKIKDDKVEYAIKIFDGNTFPYALREISILRLLDKSPNIPSILDILVEITIEERYKCGLVMPLYKMDVYDWVDSGCDPNIITQAKIIDGLCEALRYTHINGVIHRDVKPANIMIDDNSVVLIDWNGSKLFHKKNRRQTFEVQTMYFRAPEVIIRFDGKYCNKIDIWSLGCVIYFIYHKKLLFSGNCVFDMIGKIFEVCEFPNNSFFPDESTSEMFECSPVTLPTVHDDKHTTMMQKCLVIDPKERSDIFELLGENPKLFETKVPYFDHDKKLEKYLKDMYKKSSITYSSHSRNLAIFITGLYSVINPLTTDEEKIKYGTASLYIAKYIDDTMLLNESNPNMKPILKILNALKWNVAWNLSLK